MKVSFVGSGSSFKSMHFKKKSVPYAMLLPAFALISIFMFYPIFNTFYLSTQNYVLTNKADWGFIGFDNFVELFQDPIFFKALFNSLIWTMSNVLLQTLLGLMLALILNQQFKGRGLCRALLFTPWAVGGILVALMFSFMLSESVGVINDLLLKLGIIDRRISWFSTGEMSMAAVVLANTWRGIPFFAISILSALQTIPSDIYESAEIDGASAGRQFFSITLSMIRDTLVLTTLLRTIWTLNVVDIIFGMTRGGPNFSTLTVPVYIMMVFNDSLDMGYASTIAVVMTIILLIFSAGYLIVSRYGKDEKY